MITINYNFYLQFVIFYKSTALGLRRLLSPLGLDGFNLGEVFGTAVPISRSLRKQWCEERQRRGGTPLKSHPKVAL